MHISISSLILIAIVIITIVVEESKIRKKSNALNTLVFKSKREVDKQMQANYHEEILHLDKELIKDRHSYHQIRSRLIIAVLVAIFFIEIYYRYLS